jgi:hypothetical protein
MGWRTGWWGIEEWEEPVFGCSEFTSVFMDACQQEQDIACGGCSIAPLKEIQKFDRVGVKQCSLEFSAGGEIVTVTSSRKLGGKFTKQERECAMQWLEAAGALSHEPGISGPQDPQTGPEGFRIRTFDRLSEAIEFAEHRAVGGQPLKIVCDLGIGRGLIGASRQGPWRQMHCNRKRCQQNRCEVCDAGKAKHTESLCGQHLASMGAFVRIIAADPACAPKTRGAVAVAKSKPSAESRPARIAAEFAERSP